MYIQFVNVELGRIMLKYACDKRRLSTLRGPDPLLYSVEQSDQLLRELQRSGPVKSLILVARLSEPDSGRGLPYVHTFVF